MKQAGLPHYHQDELGRAVKCYHVGVSWAKQAFWYALGLTTSFPLEHWIWENGPLRPVAVWLGLTRNFPFH